MELRISNDVISIPMMGLPYTSDNEMTAMRDALERYERLIGLSNVAPNAKDLLMFYDYLPNEDAPAAFSTSDAASLINVITGFSYDKIRKFMYLHFIEMIRDGMVINATSQEVKTLIMESYMDALGRGNETIH